MRLDQFTLSHRHSPIHADEQGIDQEALCSWRGGGAALNTKPNR
jgi:hypothetical protein